MSSWNANWSRWSVTISRVAVIGSPADRTGTAAWRPGTWSIPSQIIGFKRPSVNDHGNRGLEPRQVAYAPLAAAFSSEVVGNMDFPRRATLRRIQASGIGTNQK